MEKLSEIFRAMDGTIYESVDQGSRIAALKTSMLRIMERRGLGPSFTDAAKTAEALDESVAMFYGDQMTLAEVGLALTWGSHGEYGDYNGVNADRLFRYVKAYMESEDRVLAAKRRRQEIKAREGDVPRSVINVRNWDSCCEETLLNWGEFLAGRFRPAGGDDGSEIGRWLATAHRHVLAGCYLWLKSVGIAGDDDAAAREEKEAVRRARRTCPEGTPDSVVRTWAGAYMLERFFGAERAAGDDLTGRIEEERVFASPEDKDRMTWRELAA